MQVDTASTWSEERVETLKKLWQDGLSASQIAGRLGGVTRNAVIGKVHRLGLSGRATTSRMKSHRPRRAAQPNQKRLAKPRFGQLTNSPLQKLYQGEGEPYVPAAEDVEIPLAERKYISTLTESCCRWPIGDPQHDDFHFCGKNKVAGLPYCEVHARRAFQPPQSRRRDSYSSRPAALSAPSATPATEPTKTPTDKEQV